jgi:hypothetical protein
MAPRIVTSGRLGEPRGVAVLLGRGVPPGPAVLLGLAGELGVEEG